MPNAFGAPPSPQLVVVTLSVDQVKLTNRLQFVILTETFLSYTPTGLGNAVMPWSDWGEQNARVFDDIRWLAGNGIHMFRICTEDYILDFNPNLIAYDLHKRDDSDIYAKESVIHSDFFTDGVVRSRLPFRRVTCREAKFENLADAAKYPGDPILCFKDFTQYL